MKISHLKCLFLKYQIIWFPKTSQLNAILISTISCFCSVMPINFTTGWLNFAYVLSFLTLLYNMVALQTSFYKLRYKSFINLIYWHNCMRWFYHKQLFFGYECLNIYNNTSKDLIQKCINKHPSSFNIFLFDNLLWWLMLLVCFLYLQKFFFFFFFNKALNIVNASKSHKWASWK